MRVTVQTLDEFQQNVLHAGVPAEHVFRKVIHLATTRKPLQATTPCLKFAVAAHVTAVLVDNLGSDFLLEAAIDCGLDFMDAPLEQREGTRAIQTIQQTLETFARTHALQVLPGLIEI